MSVTFKFNVAKTKALQATLQGYVKKMPKTVGTILKQEADTIMVSAKESYVPKDLGNLANSGKVANPEIKGSAIQVKLGFGAGAEEYATAVHEHPSGASPPSWANGVKFKTGGPKYLEKPVRLAAAGMGGRIAKKIRQFLIRNA